MKWSYTLYDSVLFGTALGGEQTLFQVPQGGDATHTKAFTNMRGSGFLPQNESFEIDKIGIYSDFALTLPADAEAMWLLSYFEVRVNDESVLFLPLRSAAQYNAFGGHYSQATAANDNLAGLMNDGYSLKIPITVKGGVGFKVIVNQGTVLSAANVPIRVCLHGTLDRT